MMPRTTLSERDPYRLTPLDDSDRRASTHDQSRVSELPRETVLILAPLGKDAEYAKHVLHRAGLKAETCTDLGRLCDLITEEIGVLLIAEEALTPHQAEKLIRRLAEQPPWSDIPIVIFTSGSTSLHGGEATEATMRVLRLFEKSGNVTLLERPVHALTLVSSIQVALRARRRQWEIRELLQQRELLLKEARAAREEAESANRMKDQFLATLSHELRTPLNAILGWTQLMSSGDLPLKDLRIGVQTIDRNARTQAQLIEDLLDVSRIVSGKLRLDLQEVDVAEVLRAALDAVSQTASTRGVHLSFEPSPEIPPVVVDPARLQQIVWNLLSNGVKFTPKGGMVVLKAECTPQELVITVTDTGIGIDQEFLPYVFDRFRQADGSSTRRQGGLGLGLSIVKQLVEMHGGSVRVESEGIGNGSKFTVTLPISGAQSKSAERIAAEAAGFSRNAAAIHAGAAADSAPDQLLSGRDLAGLNVLVVDDEADARNVLQRLLSDRNALVRAADSVTHALHLIDESRPDLIISDISMPERDGFDLLHEIRTDGHRAKDVPVIALTAYARAEDREKILRAGFSAHIAKPLNAADLIDAIKRS